MAIKIEADNFVTIDQATGLPVWVKYPTVEELQSIVPTDPEGMKLLHRMEAAIGFQDPVRLADAQTKYLERFNITPGNPLYKQQLADLSNTVNSNKVLVATVRRNTERAQTADMIRATGGNPQLIRIAEGEDPCESCLPLDGETGTYEYFVSENIRPGDQCRGGDNCLCILVPFTES